MCIYVYFCIYALPCIHICIYIYIYISNTSFLMMGPGPNSGRLASTGGLRGVEGPTRRIEIFENTKCEIQIKCKYVSYVHFGNPNMFVQS